MALRGLKPGLWGEGGVFARNPLFKDRSGIYPFSMHFRTGSVFQGIVSKRTALEDNRDDCINGGRFIFGLHKQYTIV